MGFKNGLNASKADITCSGGEGDGSLIAHLATLVASDHVDSVGGLGFQFRQVKLHRVFVNGPFPPVHQHPQFLAPEAGWREVPGHGYTAVCYADHLNVLWWVV